MYLLLDIVLYLGEEMDVMEDSYDSCPAYECVKERLSAELGLPGANASVYRAITRIASNVAAEVAGEVPITVEDSESVLLDGQGTSESPVSARLAETAIRAGDDTMSVEYNENGTFELRALVAEPMFASPDGSLSIVPPALEGEGYTMQVATTITGTPSITATRTAGPPPDYSLAIPTSAIVGAAPAPGITPVTVDYTGGIFALSIPFAVEGSLPKTVVVGGDIGSTPSATTLEEAITIVNTAGTATYDSPWQILMTPGEYGTAATSATLPVNTYVTALQPGSVSLLQDLSWADATAVDTRVGLRGLWLRGALTVTTSGKTGGTSLFSIDESRTFGALTTTARAGSSVTTSDARKDLLDIHNSRLDGNLTMTGGLVEIRNSNYTAGTVIVNAAASDLGTKLQVKGSIMSPVNLTNYSYFSIVSSEMEGNWTNDGATAFASIISCTPIGGNFSWALNLDNTSKTYMKDTPHNITLLRNGSPATSFTYSSTQLGTNTLGLSGTVDRDIDMELIDIAPSTSINVTLQIALGTPVYYTPATTGGQPALSSFQVTGGLPGVHPGYSASTNKILVVNNSATGTTSAALSVRVPRPSTALWF